jgi:hypothetical protein
MTDVLARHRAKNISVSRRTLTIGAVAIGLVALVVIFIAMYLYARNSNLPLPEVLSSCIARVGDLAKTNYGNYDAVTQAINICNNSSGYQLLLDEEIIRVDNLVFQRQENGVLLIMVVAITLSGVILAGLQLLASYKLAVLGKGDLSGGGEVVYGKDNVSFKSSVVGLVILAVSFGFFLVFVLDVYVLKPEDGTSREGQGRQVSTFVPNHSEIKAPTAPVPTSGEAQSPASKATPN